MSPLAPRRSALALAALSFFGLGLSTAPARAGSLEQVTRISGAQGWSPLLVNETRSYFTSDTGRFAIFRSIPIGFQFPGTTFWLRDIVTNQTRSLGEGTTEVFGVDKAETNVLVRRFDSSANKTSLVLQPIAGGTPKVLYTWNGSFEFDAALSGDGKVAAVSSGQDAANPWLYTLTVATGALKLIDTADVDLGPNSISDDGQVIAGLARKDYKGVYYRGTAKTATPARTIVSPNGAVVAAVNYQDGAHKLLVRTLATGVVKTFSLPEGLYDVQWISTDGRTFATPATENTEPATPAKVLSTSTGVWSTLTGPYADAPKGSLIGIDSDAAYGSAVSRSGRYAQVSLANRIPFQRGLVDLTGADLPGDQEPLAPTAYVDISRPLVTCNDGEVQASVSAYFGQRYSWIPRPKSATIRVTAGGTELFNETLTNPGTPGQYGGDLRDIPFPRTATSLTYSVKVVDAENRTVSTTETAQTLDLCGE